MADVAPPAVAPELAAPAPAPVAVAMAEPAPPPMPFVNVPRKAARAPVKTAVLHRASAPATKPPLRTAALTRGSSGAVVQLGSYSDADRVLVAWNKQARKFHALQAYAPMSARYASPKGVFYRLSVKGFGSVNEAAALCSSVRRSGGSCFVRNVAGDTPVEIASR
jgi:sporulation related protein